jgi:valyl-tRNA synthetase
MLPKAYDPKAVEDRIYAMWEQSGAFRADAASEKEAFSIAMPPPNATGQLHLGHAVMLALEDIFIRFERMHGKETLWLPGTDHASIATEAVVIKQIQKEEKIPDPRAKLGRAELIKRIADYVERSRGTIRSQIRKMGASCDWTRERYTLEPAMNRVVNDVFAKMYGDGLIYRGHRIVNWDPKMQTTVSDDEIEWLEEQVHLYTFQYGPFQISTARPETKFGDKYVVMHPDDERYATYVHGSTFEAEWINGLVKATVIKDKAVDPSFGTGVMTITPWHDAADFEIAERHKLEKQQIIGFDGKLLPIAGEFAGMRIDEARPKVVEKLREKGLLVKEDPSYVHRVAVSYRGGGMIEPQIKEQWFVSVDKRVVQWRRRELSLKEVMQEVVHTGLINIIPERFEKEYFRWIDNLRDWCISRQIWWGHRIPVWYRKDAGAIDIHVGALPPKGEGWEQDPDTLDTWFSTGLWTWSTLIDPSLAQDASLTLEELLEKSPDFRKFHPTQIMETGYDILFFWVARMILMTTYVTGDVPFETVYLHGLIRARDGRKMSKSDPDTMIDPLDMIAKYGADALRLSLTLGQSPGADSRLYEEKIAGYRNFVNKLWNASRFVLMQCEERGVDPHAITTLPSLKELSLADRALLHALEVLTEDVTDGLQKYRLSEVGERLYSFTWDYFCDWYLEFSKESVNFPVLVHALRRILKLLHPYTPFVTEELWASVKPHDAGMLIAEQWPALKPERKDQESFDQLQRVIDVVSAIRKVRAEYAIDPKKELAVTVMAKEHADLLRAQEHHIRRLGRVGDLAMAEKAPREKNTISMFLTGIEVHVSLEGVIDLAKERKNVEKELAGIERLLATAKEKLDHRDFTEKAPPEVVQAEREKMRANEEKRGKLEERLKALS